MIATAIATGIEFRPTGILPADGTLQVLITGDPSTIACPHPHENVTLANLYVNVSSVEVHRTGALGLTGDWRNVTNTPQTIDLLQIRNTAQLLGSATLPEGTITSVRLNIASATATTDKGSVPVVVSGGKLEASLSPSEEVRSGTTTSLVVEPHVVCEGNMVFRLTPDLTATSRETR